MIPLLERTFAVYPETKVYSEDDHPRDERGQFASGGVSTATGQSLLERTETSGGFTYSPSSRSMPSDGVALSPYPERERVVVATDLTSNDILSYAKDNHDVLTQPDHYIGAWHNTLDGNVYLDVSVVTQDKDDANVQALMQQYNQIAAYDLGSGTEIHSARPELHQTATRRYYPWEVSSRQHLTSTSRQPDTRAGPSTRGQNSQGSRRAEASIARFAVYPERKDFDESLHPRDAGGKFGQGDDGAAVPTAWVDKTNEIRSDEIPKLAALHFYSPEEYVAACDRRAKELLQGTNIYVRVNEANLGKILRSGAFKSQFETGGKSSGTGGKVGLSVRSEFEEKVLGIAPDIDPSQRPIYGMATADPTGDVQKAGWTEGRGDSGAMYGDVAVRLKDDVKGNSTVTFGDSLSGTMGGQLHTFSPVPFNDPSSLGMSMELDVQKDYTYKNDPLDIKTLDDIRYAEVQVNGGVKASDIDSVVFGRGPTPATVKLLSKANIPYSVVGVSA
jgi:hypothetical protein